MSRGDIVCVPSPSHVREALEIHCFPSGNRSKFNVPLGVESQGFCILPHAQEKRR